MSSISRWGASIVFASTLHTAAYAQNAQEPKEPSREIEDVGLDELLGHKLEDTLGTTEAVSRKKEDVLSAPATVSTLDADAIRLSGARTIPDLLRFTPGVQVVQTAPGSYLVAIRGMSGLTGNNVVVTVDGIPINNPLDGSIDWGLIPVAVRDVERIEVVRGPVSTIYGANAYTGVINIITYRGYGSLPHGAARAEGGADTELSPTGNVSVRQVRNDKRFQYAVFAEGNADGTNRTAEFGPDHPSLYKASALGRLGFTFDDGQLDLELAAAYASRPSIEHLSLEHERERRLNSFLSARFVTKNQPGVLGRVALWGRTTLQSTDANASDFTGFTYAGTRSSRSSLGTDVDFDLHRTFVTTIGGVFDIDYVDAPYINPGESDVVRGGAGFYARSTWDPTEQWTFEAAFRGDVPTVTAETAPSYRASAVFHESSYAVRAAAGSAYRAPTYVEAGGRFIDPATGLILLEGAPSIPNPRNDAIELGLLLSPHVDLSFSATVYASRVSNLTVEEFDPLARRSFDSEQEPTYLLGGELETKWVESDALVWTTFGSIVRHFTEEDGTIPTVAVAGMSSTFIGGTEFRGSLRQDKMRYGLGAVFSTRRSYTLATGIPPVLLTREVDPNVVLTGLVEHELVLGVPFWLSARVQAHLPRQVESPVPGSSLIGSSALIGLEHRWGE